jgi:hypothetical protein
LEQILGDSVISTNRFTRLKTTVHLEIIKKAKHHIPHIPLSGRDPEAEVLREAGNTGCDYPNRKSKTLLGHTEDHC